MSQTDLDHWLRLLKSKAASDRARAIQALATMGAAAVPDLIAILNDRRQRAAVRETAAITLGRIGADARPAVATLVELVRNWRISFWSAVADALYRIDPDTAARERVGLDPPRVVCSWNDLPQVD